MSEILDKLKDAEAQRQRIIAERRRLEAEADAALAAQEREDAVRRAKFAGAAPRAPAEGASAPAADAAPARTPQQGSRFAAALAIGAALAVVFWIGTLVPQEPQRPAPVAPAQATRAPAPPLFMLDRDAEAFAARARDRDGK